MNLDTMYPSKWLKAGDLQGQTLPVVIARVVMEDVGDESGKPVAYFQGRDKGLVLNKTNAMSIGLVHGAETDGWVGKTIELFPAVVMFQGQNVPCIRVRPVAQAYAEAYAGATQQQAPISPQPPVGPATEAADLAKAQAAQAPLPTEGSYGAVPQPAPAPLGPVPTTDGDGTAISLDDKIKF